MKFSHNKPNSEPAINKFIEMEHPIPFLETNRFYLMPSMPEEVAISINQTLTDMMDVDEKPDDLFNSYTCIHLRNLPFSDTVIFKQDIMKEGYNVLLLLNNYNVGPYKYLMAKIEENDLKSQIRQIIETSEELTKECLAKMILEKIKNKQMEIKDILPPNDFEKLPIYSIPTVECCVMNAMNPEFLDFKGVVGGKVGEDIGFIIKQNMQKRMVENVKKLNKSNDVRAVEELRLMLRSVPTEYLIEMLKKFSTSQLIKASECLDPQTYAKNSHLRFEICRPSEMPGYELPKNKKIKNIGTYMLFICNGQTFEPVVFSYKSSFIVYLIYMIDRFKKKDSIEPIDMLDKERENEYYKLYNIIYPYHTDEAKNSYFSMTSEFKKDSEERRKKRLGDCYADIKVCVGSVCHKMGEIINPHIIENAGDHLATMPNKIHIPFELLL